MDERCIICGKIKSGHIMGMIIRDEHGEKQVVDICVECFTQNSLSNLYSVLKRRMKK